jgi:DNA-binding response OmpR family regulator
LVVEDDEKEGKAIVALLRREGVEVALAASAKAALTQQKEFAYGCVIHDLGHPDTDVLMLLAEL